VYGHLPAAASAASAASASVAAPIELSFVLNDSLRRELVRADEHLQTELIDALDTTFGEYSGFGKSEIKQMGFSPDAFVQTAFQLAYGRLYDGVVPATYEACSTAAFFHGRQLS
jgi:hypothetical protein